MAKAPFVAQWLQAGADIFQWGRKAAYWKGRKGWWASRQDMEGIKGPFRSPGAAQKWAEEPFREQHRQAQQVLDRRRTRVAAQKAHAVELAQAREAKELVTWKGLPVEARKVEPGQVWTLRDASHGQHQILVVEVKKTIAVVQARDSKATPWKGLAREPRTLTHLPRLYRLVGKAKVSALPKRQAS